MVSSGEQEVDEREAGERETGERETEEGQPGWRGSPGLEIQLEGPAETVDITLETKLAKDLLLALTRSLGRAAYND